MNSVQDQFLVLKNEFNEVKHGAHAACVELIYNLFSEKPHWFSNFILAQVMDLDFDMCHLRVNRLMREYRLRFRCPDLVAKVAVYQDRGGINPKTILFECKSHDSQIGVAIRQAQEMIMEPGAEEMVPVVFAPIITKKRRAQLMAANIKFCDIEMLDLSRAWWELWAERVYKPQRKLK